MPTKGTSSKTKTAAQRQREREKAEQKARQQLWAIVVFAFGLLLFFITLIPGQNVWQWFHNLILGTFGWSAYLIAPIFLYIAVMTTLDKPLGSVGHKVWQTLILVCLFSGATQVFGEGIPSGNLIEKIVYLFEGGIKLESGGAISALFGLPLMYWFGETGARITMVLLIFVCIMILTGGTLVGLYLSAKKPVKKIEEVYVAHAEERQRVRAQRQEEQRAARPSFNIDIPVGEPVPPQEDEPVTPRMSSFEKAKQKKEEQLDEITEERIQQARRDAWKERTPQPQEEAPKEEPAPPAEEVAAPAAVEETPAEESPTSEIDDLISRIMGPKAPDPAPAAPQPEEEEDDVFVDLFDENQDLIRPVTDFGDGRESLRRMEAEMEPEDLIRPEELVRMMDAKAKGQAVFPPAVHLRTEETAASQPSLPQEAPAAAPAAKPTSQPVSQPVAQEAPAASAGSEPARPTLRRSTDFEVIEVPPERLSEEGIGREGVSFSVTEEEPEPEPEPEYIFPPVEILNDIQQPDQSDLQEELRHNAEKLVDTLQSFGVQTRIIDIARGPAVTRYELQPSAGVKISRITNLADDIALNLAASGVRIEAPIPGKPAVGIEVPNKTVSTVSIREMLESEEFDRAESRLSVALGRDIAGQVTIADLGKMPHVLIAGATGSGKSVCINSLIVSLLYKSTPQEVKMLLIDPKMVELGIYNGIPHLLVPVVTDPKKAAGALSWAVNEMLNRYQLFKDNNVRDLKGYNRMAAEKGVRPMPQVVIIIDELADLMMAAPGEVEDSICRLAQMARAAGMHLVIATQRPSVDVITGVIKANIPSRIAFAVSSQIDSRTILDSAGAEKLLGRGDMLFSPVGASKPTRVQGCFVTDGEVERIVEFIKQSGMKLTYDQQIIEEIDRHTVADKKKGDKGEGGGFDEEDEMLPSAIECVVESGIASTSLLQRKLKLGYARAARIMDAMEEKGIIGPFEGSKPRQVLISKERWMEMKLISAQKAEDEKRNY